MTGLVNDYELGSDPLVVGTGMHQYSNWSTRSEQGRQAQADGVRIHLAISRKHIQGLRFTSVLYLDQWYLRRDLLDIVDAIARQDAMARQPAPKHYWVDVQRARAQLRFAELEAILS